MADSVGVLSMVSNILARMGNPGSCMDLFLPRPEATSDRMLKVRPNAIYWG
jgi:hypothetical protein